MVTLKLRSVIVGVSTRHPNLLQPALVSMMDRDRLFLRTDLSLAVRERGR